MSRAFIDPRVAAFLNTYFKRVFLLYLLAAAFLVWGTRFPYAFNHAKFTALNRYIPKAENMVIFKEDPAKLTEGDLKEFERYYEKAALFMPRSAEARALKGYSYYYGGDKVKAQRAYSQAVRMNPKLFNFYYNLGIIALDRKDHKKAFAHFKDSVAVDPGVNVQSISGSVWYIMFLPSVHQPQLLANAVGTHVRDQYRRGYLQLLISCELLNDHASMLLYARKAIANDFLNQGVFYYYAGLAAYQLNEPQQAVVFLQEAVKHKFQYAQVYQVLGLSLRALGRPESEAAFKASMSLLKDEKIYRPEAENRGLLIF